MFDEYGRRLSARQKLTRETLVFFGNFTRQNGVVEHQLDIGFQAITAGQFSNARASRNGVLSLPITPCSSASATA